MRLSNKSTRARPIETNQLQRRQHVSVIIRFAFKTRTRNEKTFIDASFSVCGFSKASAGFFFFFLSVLNVWEKKLLSFGSG